MVKIRLDIPDGFSNVLESQINQAATAAISSTMMVTKSKWETIAQRKLNTTAADFMLGLNADDSIEFPDQMTGVLTLRGTFPNMLESGYPSYDMKQGFGRSEKRKTNAEGGWYMHIPFRHRTPGTAGTAVGGSAMPEDIYSQARKLRGNTGRLEGTETSYPARTSHTGYQHKSGIYEGMRKNRKQYEKTSQNSYFTFRTVSSNSDPASWIHPGFEGLKAFAEVDRYARDTVQKVFEENIRQIMG